MDENKVIQKLVDHDEQLSFIRENMATGSDVREIKSVLESLVTIVKKIDEDHTFAVEWLKRLQTQVEKQEEDIRLIKLKLQMA